jgi:pimeloyl-ACP methyl ester carboxylesterase
MAVLGHSLAETMALRPQYGCCKVKFQLILVAAPQFLTVPVTSDKFTLRLHGSNSVNPSGWRDAFAGKSLLCDEAARLTVLLRITPRGGEGLTFTDRSPDELDDLESLVLKALFSPSETSQTAGCAYLGRLRRRVADRDGPVLKTSAGAEIAALREWGAVPNTDRFAMLHEIRHPTLIAHGNKDVVVMPINALLLVQHLPNAQLIVYPDASHAAHSQHAETFLRHVQLFFQGSAA